MGGVKDACELARVLRQPPLPWPLSSEAEERGMKTGVRVTPGWRSLTRLPGATIRSPLTGFQFGAVARRKRDMFLPSLQHDPNRPEDVLKVDADEDGVGGDDAADCLRYLVATKERKVTQRKLRGL